MAQQNGVVTKGEEDLFQVFQTVVHLCEDIKNCHAFVVMGASVS